MPTTTEQDTAKQQQLPLPSTVKGILFDMDGTLTDSDTLHFEAYRETFLKVHIIMLGRVLTLPLAQQTRAATSQFEQQGV